MSVIGIDLGDEYSVVAVVRRRGIDICANEVSKRETATLVGFSQKLRQLGEAAASQQASNLKNTIGGFKRILGAPFNDPEVQREIAGPVQTVATRDGTVGYKVYYNGDQRVFSSVQIMAMFLFRLREIAEKEVGARVHDCVVSTPLWYTEQQRRALFDAAHIAGLNVLGLLNDITASAVAWGMPRTDLPETPTIVGFVDLGASTTSVSIVQFTNTRMDVLGTAYDRNLGGRDFDSILYEHFAAQARAMPRPLDVSQNARASFRLRAACNKLKLVLSANSLAVTTVECLMEDRDLPLKVSRDEFTVLAKPLLQRMQALALLGEGPTD